MDWTRHKWKESRLTPSQMLEMTPNEFDAMIVIHRPDPGVDVRQNALRRQVDRNRQRGQRGLRPYLPPSMVAEMNERGAK